MSRRSPAATKERDLEILRRGGTRMARHASADAERSEARAVPARECIIGFVVTLTTRPQSDGARKRMGKIHALAELRCFGFGFASVSMTHPSSEFFYSLPSFAPTANTLTKIRTHNAQRTSSQ